ncbi:MAG: M48 family metalloprotease [archaeon]|nr:M48 family metalloprotease [archaeon]
MVVIALAGLVRLKQAMSLTILLVFGIFAGLVTFLAILFNFSLVSSLILGAIIAILFMIIQYAIGPAIVASSTKLRYLNLGENPWLEEVVKEISDKAGIPPPRLAIVQDPTPNAFVFGHTASDATLALHKGLLEELNKEEVRGVIGHELGHIKHRDFIVITMLSVIPLICYIIARSLFWAQGTSGKREKGGGIVIAAIVAYIIYIISMLFVLYLSRLREHYADAYSAYITSSPRSLESGLTKIAWGLSLAPTAPSGARAFFIEDPAQAKADCGRILENKSRYDLDKDGVLDEHELMLAMEEEARSKWTSANELFATHPPVFKRMLLLRQIEQEMVSGRYTDREVYKFV